MKTANTADQMLTIELLKRNIEEFENAQMDREIDILLSDNGPAILSYLHGGKLVEVDGRFFVISRECSEMAFKPRFGDWV